jgi:hypothetical protein
MSKHIVMAIRALRTMDHQDAPDWADVAETELAAYKITIEQDAKEIAAAHNVLTAAGMGQGTLPERITDLLEMVQEELKSIDELLKEPAEVKYAQQAVKRVLAALEGA